MSLSVFGCYTWRCPMKEDGAEETCRLSVKMPVSTLLNSRRVWSPAIWPEAEEGRERGEEADGWRDGCEGRILQPKPHTATAHFWFVSCWCNNPTSAKQSSQRWKSDWNKTNNWAVNCYNMTRTFIKGPEIFFKPAVVCVHGLKKKKKWFVAEDF